MELKLVIDGDVKIVGGKIQYTGVVLDGLLEVRLHCLASRGHAGNGPKIMSMYVKRLVRGTDDDLLPARKLCGDDGLIASAPFVCTLVMLNPSLPSPDTFVGKYTFRHVRIAEYYTHGDEGNPVQEFRAYLSGANQSGRDGAPMLSQPVTIHGFNTI